MKKRTFNMVTTAVICLVASLSRAETGNLEKINSQPEVLKEIRVFNAHYITEAPCIDGKLNDYCWSEAKKTTDFMLLGKKKSTDAQTSAWVLYDENNLYIAFECLEPNVEQIVKKQVKRNSAVWGDDCIEVFLDPSHNGKDYYHLAVNATSTRYDNFQGDKVSGKIYWQAKSSIGKDRWFVELVIPFSDLGLKKPDKGDVWGLNLCRERQVIRENSSWSTILSSFHEPQNFGELVFGKNKIDIEKVQLCKKGVNVDLVNLTGKDRKILAKLLVEDSTGKTITPPAIEKEIKETGSIFLPCPLTSPGNYNINLFLENLVEKSPSRKFLYSLMIKSPGLNSIVWPAEDHDNTLFICSNTAQHFFIVAANHSKKVYKNVTALIDVPEGIELIDPTNCPLVSYYPNSLEVKELKIEKVKREGTPYSRYNLLLNKHLPEGRLQGIPFYKGLLLFIKLMNKNIKEGKSYNAYYRLISPGEKEKEHRFKIVVLPEIKGKQPKKISLEMQPWACRANLPEWYALIDVYKTIGINCIDWSGWEIPAYAEKVRKENMKMIRSLYFYWWSKEYLNKHPDHGALSFKGLKDKLFRVCPTILLENEGVVLKEISGFLQTCRKEGIDIINWDLEGPNPWDICFCNRCIEKFRDFAAIPKEQKLTPILIKAKYSKQWIDFCCRQNTEICSFTRKEFKKIRKDAALGVYSSTSLDFAKSHYRIDWEGLIKNRAIDIAYLSFYSPNPNNLTNFTKTLKSLLKVLRAQADSSFQIKTTLTTGYGRNQLVVRPPKLVKLQILKSVIHGANGVSFWHWATNDGRHYQAMAEASELIADLEDFFTKGKNDDRLVELSKKQGVSHAVWVKDNLRAVFIFNHNSKSPVTLSVENLKLPKSRNTVAWDYINRKHINLHNPTVTILPLDVAVIIIGPKEDIEKD